MFSEKKIYININIINNLNNYLVFIFLYEN